eukprot:TRINITY_DN145_c0_g1_i2.p1 TRINITY_DN145_c0_g1~~TRINITY_DN145_c0_g1_i2.p1  ORF type:complete len:618 (+),score=69.88 TRINITY_DN145_c0_g1_i2:36-1856(+)
MVLTRSSSRSQIKKMSVSSSYPLVVLPIVTLLCLSMVLILQPLAITQFQVDNHHEIYSRVLLQQSDQSRPLMFQACNGFANQRISIVFGVLAGILSRRNVLLPRLPLNGEQRQGGDNIDGSSDNTMRFSQLYNMTVLQKVLQKHSLLLLEQDQTNAADSEEIHKADCGDMSFQQCLALVQSVNKTIDIGCGFPANLVTPDILLQHESLFNDILSGLVPVDEYQKEIDEAIEKVGKIAGEDVSGKYNLLHLRVEEDWTEHCAIWSNIPDGIVRDNCMSNTDVVGDVLMGMLEDPSLPLVISYNTNVDPANFEPAMQSINQHNFKVVTNTELNLKEFQREVSAMINYFMALQAQQFIGNSVSSFSALMILERRGMQSWASYYNGGNIPMQAFVPLYQMPWVLVDNCQDAHNFKQEVLPVLIQGIVVGTLEAHLYCDSGEKINQQILDLAQQYKIDVIEYKQIDMYTNNSPQNALYAVSMLPWLRQYGYVFFTSSSVWFERQVSLDTFRLPLPSFQRDYTIQSETHSQVRLMNTQFIRDQIVKNSFDINQYNIEVTEGENVVSQFPGQGESVTPILSIDSTEKPNKWDMIRNCKYPAFQQQGFCNEVAA